MRLQVGVVGRAHHGGTGGVRKSQGSSFPGVELENIGVNVTQNGKVMRRRGEILADGQHFNIVGTHLAQNFQDFLVGFPQPHHEAGFAWNTGVLRLELLEQLERMGIVRSGTGLFVKTRYGFQIMVEDIRRGGRENIQGDIHAPTKIRNEDFDGRVRGLLADFPYALGKMLRAAVAQVVTVDAGDDDVFEFQRSDAAGELFRFGRVRRERLAVANVAKRAAAGT